MSQKLTSFCVAVSLALLSLPLFSEPQEPDESQDSRFVWEGKQAETAKREANNIEDVARLLFTDLRIGEADFEP